MNDAVKIIKAIIFSMLFMGCYSIVTDTVFAAELRAVQTAEDVGNGYRFEVPGIGGFTSNARAAETVSVAVIDLDEGLNAKLIRDGTELSFKKNITVTDNGSYTLKIYRDNSENFGVYSFNIKNDFEDMVLSDKSEIKLVENPELSLEYNEENEFFRYSLPSGLYIDMNIPIGAYTSREVIIRPAEGVNIYSVRKDGELIPSEGEFVFNEYGSYSIDIRSNELGFSGEESYKLSLNFKIIDKKRAADTDYIPAPMGFVPYRALIDGREAKAAFKGQGFELADDGVWSLSFKSANVLYETRLTRDSTAPALSFSEDINKDVLKKSVKFSKTEADTDIKIFKNYQPVTAQNGVIAQNGSYRILASDSAGNTREYSFNIRKKLRVFTPFTVAIPVMLLISAYAISRYWKKHMKVL